MYDSLFSHLKTMVTEWRRNGYPSDFPVISEILNYNYEPEKEVLRYLRKSQYEALETYWYLRLVENTPHIFDLYKRIYNDPKELFNSLSLSISSEDLIDIMSSGTGIQAIFEKIKNDDSFVKKYNLEGLKETLSLTYPSYILALAMGAGKTVLIGSIIATEFAMSLEYRQSNNFVKNTLVFAPGKTILGALKELSDVPYDKILPPRLYKEFITSVKFIYTRDGEKDIPVIPKSYFNIIVTNTEKIRIQKQSIRKSLIKNLFTDLSKEDEVKQEIANRRLQTIASLPDLAIFSDEAHHTYGQALNKDLKRVRQTVNYLAEKTNVLVVINTTGTPYYKKQILKDVIYWYGLSKGIQDGILKEVKNNIIAYPKVKDKDFIKDIIEDFFNNYENIKIYDGSPAKMAIYFPKIEDLRISKPIVERTLVSIGQDPSIVLEVHNESDDDIKDLFDNRINDPKLPYRVFLLVNKGTEGWNCLSLFSCALARELKKSNNFCLQAACRCLRQIPGNNSKAKIYLSEKNVKILDLQLKETYGETLQDLNISTQNFKKDRLILRKIQIPPILINKKIKKVIPYIKKEKSFSFDILKPKSINNSREKTIYDLRDIPDTKGVLIKQSQEEIVMEEDFLDIFHFAVELSSLYDVSVLPIYEKLMKLYPEGDITLSQADNIKMQIEEKMKNYKIVEEEIEVALALVKPEHFNKEEKDKHTVYTTEIVFHKNKENLLLKYDGFKERNKGWYQLDFGFHYTPYNFDSNPEKDFYIKLLNLLNEDPSDVEDIYFTGAITDPNKTDFLFEYKGKDGKYHNYTPDFLIKKKNGKVIIIEIKGEPYEDEEKEKAIKEIEGLNPEKLKYEILKTSSDVIGFHNINKVKEDIYGK